MLRPPAMRSGRLMPLREMPAQSAELGLLLLAFIIAALSQLARLLSGTVRLTPLRLFAGALGAGVAGLALTALALDRLEISLNFGIFLASVVGWIGGNALSAGVAVIEARLGLNVQGGPGGQP